LAGAIDFVQKIRDGMVHVGADHEIDEGSFSHHLGAFLLRHTPDYPDDETV